ncbi:MAG: cytochrome c family protein [Caulobacterales bacterium]|nr:cytochrome c family protein [Caulobacterales bacterium]
MRKLLMSAALIATLVACGPSPTPQAEAPASAPASSTPAPATPAAEGPSAEQVQAALAALPAPYNAANYEAGRRVFAQCRSCHTIEAGAPNRVGPNLHGVFGREIGSLEGFNYSQPVQDANFVWDAAQLDHWLQNPQTFLPGNRMAFAGVRNEEQRRDLIAYLMVDSAPN